VEEVAWFLVRILFRFASFSCSIGAKIAHGGGEPNPASAATVAGFQEEV
jgi:hypothetical protein